MMVRFSYSQYSSTALLMCHGTLLFGVVLHLIMKMVIIHVMFLTPNFIYDSGLHEKAAEMTSIPKKSIWQQPRISCLIYGHLCYEIHTTDLRSAAVVGTAVGVSL